MTWTDEGQDNRVHKDAVETIEKVIKAAKTILADEFAIQQMEYDELYGVNSKEYIAYQNLVTNYLNHRGLLGDLDAGKLLASGAGTPKPPPLPAPLSAAVMPHHSDQNLALPTPSFPSQSMQMFEEKAEGFNDALFEAVGARSSLEFNPDAIVPPQEERGELPIPPDAELPTIFTAPKVDYDPEFLPLTASIQVDEQVANAAALIASAEPDPSYASGSWSIPSQIQAPLPPLPAAPPSAEGDPYASGSWGALSQIQAPMPLTEQSQVHQFAQPQMPFASPPSPFAPPSLPETSGVSHDSIASLQPASPWAPVSPAAAVPAAAVPAAAVPAPAPAAPAAGPAADNNPWDPLPGTQSTPTPSADAFGGAPQPQAASPYASDADNDKWETGGWATITPPSNSGGANGGAGNTGTAGSGFGSPAAGDQGQSPFQWAPPEQYQNQFQAQAPYAKDEEEKKEENKSGFTFDPTKAWE